MAAGKNIAAWIRIGGVVTTSLKDAFSTTEKRINTIGEAVRKLRERERDLNRVIRERDRARRAPEDGRDLVRDRASMELATTERETESLRRKLDVLNQIEARRRRIAETTSRRRTEMFERAGVAIGIAASARVPLQAFEDLDAAMNAMQVAMVNSVGQLPAEFERIKRETIDLGTVLPGTTADFVKLATVMKERGMPVDAIAQGALNAAAKLAVVMNMVPEQEGDMVARLREAFSLSGGEFSAMADYVQRARFAFGLDPDDLLLGAKYYGGKTNALGLTGPENVRKLYAIQGMAAQQGMDGSTFGTNFSQMLTRVGMMTDRLQKNSKEMRAVSATLTKNHIRMTFFDAKGHFAGIDNMVAQLGKLSVLTQEKRIQIMTRLFGEEAARVADLISRNGTKGYQTALNKLDGEGSLDRRIGIATGSFKNRLEALGGAFTTLMAKIGEPFARVLSPIIQRLGDFIGGPLLQWVQRNQAIVLGVGEIAAGVAGIVALGGAISGMGFVLGVVGESLAIIEGALAGVEGSLAVVAGVIGGISFGPLAAGAMGFAAAGLLIHRYWAPLKAFFSGIWQGLRSGLAPFVKEIWTSLAPVGDLITGVFRALSRQVGYSAADLKGFADVGAWVGRVVARALTLAFAPLKWGAKAIGWVADRINSRFGFNQKAPEPPPMPGDATRKLQAPANDAGHPVSDPPKPGTAVARAGPGRGEATPPAAQPGRGKDVQSEPPRLPELFSRLAKPPAAQRTVNDNRTYDITINAAPGQSPKDIAREVERRARTASAGGATLTDRAVGF